MFSVILPAEAGSVQAGTLAMEAPARVVKDAVFSVHRPESLRLSWIFTLWLVFGCNPLTVKVPDVPFVVMDAAVV